ncbi:FAD-binding oxidoreductase [Vibrio profundum]|uniref:FAD-binding oxidoreductase n=1 Tax=Vibrio profundum TaxID=2910247 RepID=UPI003D13F933
MKYSVLIKPSGKVFDVGTEQSILSAAQSAGVSLRHGCMAGACRLCRTKLLKGCVKYRDGMSVFLTQEELKRNYFLPCCSVATSDIECQQDDWGGEASVDREGVVLRSKTLTGEVFILRFQLSKRSTLNPVPGQYIEVECGEGSTRAYSVANVPQRDGVLELHVKRRRGGYFSDNLCDAMQPGDVWWIRGPRGKFSFQESEHRPLLFIATGTGFSPIKSILESNQLKEDRTIQVYWGGRTKQDWYFEDIVDQLSARYADLHFSPVLSRPSKEDNWTGRVGYVQDWIESDIEHLGDYDVYACGSGAMVKHTFEVLTKQYDLPQSRFHSDAFFPSGT